MAVLSLRSQDNWSRATSVQRLPANFKMLLFHRDVIWFLVSTPEPLFSSSFQAFSLNSSLNKCLYSTLLKVTYWRLTVTGCGVPQGARMYQARLGKPRCSNCIHHLNCSVATNFRIKLGYFPEKRVKREIMVHETYQPLCQGVHALCYTMRLGQSR